MYTLDNTADTKLTHQMERIIALHFDTDVTDYVEGAVVALDPSTSKLVDIATGVYPIGFITSNANARYKEGGATVHTNFAAVVKGKADGAIAVADLLEATSWDEVNGYTAYKVAAAGKYACAFALTAVSDTEVVKVGILRSPVSVPV